MSELCRFPLIIFHADKKKRFHVGVEKKSNVFFFSFRKTIDISPSHNGENSLDDLGSTSSEPTTRAPLGLTTNLNINEHFHIDFPNCFPHPQQQQQQHYHHHHPMKSTADMIDTGSTTILRDYHSL
jgi:hypothetical protein